MPFEYSITAMSSIDLTSKRLAALSLPVGGVGGRSGRADGSVIKAMKSLRRSIVQVCELPRVQPPKAVADNSDLSILRAAVAELPALEREALVQQIGLTRSIGEIAAHLQLSETEVRTLLIRARRQLRLLCGEDVSLDPT